MNPLQALTKKLGENQTLAAALEAKAADWTNEDRAEYKRLGEEAQVIASDIKEMEKRTGVTKFIEDGGLEAMSKAGAVEINGKGQVTDEEGADLSKSVLAATMEPSYKKAFYAFMRAHGNTDRHNLKTLSDVAQKAMTEGLDTGGGVLVPADLLAEVLQRKSGLASVTDRVRVVTTNRDRIALPWFKFDDDDINSSALDFQWDGENGPADEDTNLEDWGTKTIPVYTGMFQVEITRDLLEDAFVDLESWVAGMIGDTYRMKAENLIVNGNGISKPRGFLDAVGATGRAPTVNVGNGPTADGIIDLHYALPAQYAANASYVARGSVIGVLAKLKDGANTYVGLVGDMDARGLAAARQKSILGSPLDQSDLMPASGSANNILAYADFRQAYAWVVRVGATIEPYGQADKSMLRANRRGFHVRTRVGGDLLQDRAIRIGVQS